MPENTIMILIDGAGWKTGAVKWLKDAVQQKNTQQQKPKTKKL